MKTIASEEMDGQVMEMLEKLGLSQYQWFYLGLSYKELSLITNDNIQLFLKRMRYRNDSTIKASKMKISRSAKKKIVAASLFMQNRSSKLQEFIEVSSHLMVINYTIR